MNNLIPQITVSILSWRLEDRLIKTLKSIPKTTSLPLALCLHVQGEEQISKEKRKEIHEAAQGFKTQEIYFTPFNKGAAIPRAQLLKLSSKTSYVFITDNDMDFNEGDIDILYNFLEDPANQSYGLVNLVDNTLRWHRRVDLANKRVTYFPIPTDLPKVVDIDMCGSCCLFLRSDIAKIPDIIDTEYCIGTWDIDFCMNIRKLGWKIATIADKDHIPRNDTSYRDPEFNSIKGLTKTALEGIKRFRKKWGISSEIERYKAIRIKAPEADTAIISRAIYESIGEFPGAGIITRERLESMQRFFINSLKNQTDSDFLLYVFVKEGSEATEAIKDLDWTGLNIKFLYTDVSISKWQDSIQGSGNWGRETDPGCPEDIVRKTGHPMHTIMARLDNDDWVAPGWVLHMKHMYSIIEEPNFLINYQITGQGPDGRLYKFFTKHHPAHVSPFLSLIQREGPKISPYTENHLKMGKHFKTVYTIQPSYVFMVIGSDNRSNRLYEHDRYFEDLAIKNVNERKNIVNILDHKPNLNPKPKPERSENHWKTRIIRGQERLKIKQSMGASKCPETNSFATS